MASAYDASSFILSLQGRRVGLVSDYMLQLLSALASGSWAAAAADSHTGCADKQTNPALADCSWSAS